MVDGIVYPVRGRGGTARGGRVRRALAAAARGRMLVRGVVLAGARRCGLRACRRREVAFRVRRALRLSSQVGGDADDGAGQAQTGVIDSIGQEAEDSRAEGEKNHRMASVVQGESAGKPDPFTNPTTFTNVAGRLFQAEVDRMAPSVATRNRFAPLAADDEGDGCSVVDETVGVKPPLRRHAAVFRTTPGACRSPRDRRASGVPGIAKAPGASAPAGDAANDVEEGFNGRVVSEYPENEAEYNAQARVEQLDLFQATVTKQALQRLGGTMLCGSEDSGADELCDGDGSDVDEDHNSVSSDRAEKKVQCKVERMHGGSSVTERAHHEFEAAAAVRTPSADGKIGNFAIIKQSVRERIAQLEATAMRNARQDGHGVGKGSEYGDGACEGIGRACEVDAPRGRPRANIADLPKGGGPDNWNGTVRSRRRDNWDVYLNIISEPLKRIFRQQYQ